MRTPLTKKLSPSEYLIWRINELVTVAVQSGWHSGAEDLGPLDPVGKEIKAYYKQKKEEYTQEREQLKNEVLSILTNEGIL